MMRVSRSRARSSDSSRDEPWTRALGRVLSTTRSPGWTSIALAIRVSARAGNRVRDDPVPPLGCAEARVAAGGPVLGEGRPRPRHHRAGRARGGGERVDVGNDAAGRGNVERREAGLHPARLHVDDEKRGAPRVEVLEGVAPSSEADAGLDDLLRDVDLVHDSGPAGGRVDPTPIPAARAHRRGAGRGSGEARSR